MISHGHFDFFAERKGVEETIAKAMGVDYATSGKDFIRALDSDRNRGLQEPVQKQSWHRRGRPAQVR